MPKFSVRCYDRGMWDKNEPTKVDAEDELQATIQVYGGVLVERGKLGQLMAEVWPVSDPNAKRMFYLPPEK